MTGPYNGKETELKETSLFQNLKGMVTPYQKNKSCELTGQMVCVSANDSSVGRKDKKRKEGILGFKSRLEG